MQTVRRLLFGDILWAVAFVALAFLSLFFFIDFVDELRSVGINGYTTFHALAACVLEIPGHVYELMPIAVLIGTIYALSRMAQSSEFTILRTGGLGPGRALMMLTQLGIVFAALAWIANASASASTVSHSAQPGDSGGAWFSGSTAIGSINERPTPCKAPNARSNAPDPPAGRVSASAIAPLPLIPRSRGTPPQQN